MRGPATGSQLPRMCPMPFLLLTLLLSAPLAQASAPGCVATPSSLTPAAWSSAMARVAPGPARLSLTLVKDIPLPGSASRFDYQSVDPAAGRLYISHMGAGRLVVFDLDSSRVIGE